MKKALLFVLSLLLLLCFHALAETDRETEYKSGDYRYRILEDGTAEITLYDGYAKVLEIPSELDSHPVTSIGNYAFSNCRSLTSVTIPDSVTSIGDWAFEDCNSLISVILPASVTSIGSNPFAYCDSFTKIIVPSDHPYLATIHGVLFSKPDRRLVCYPCALKAA